MIPAPNRKNDPASTIAKDQMFLAPARETIIRVIQNLAVNQMSGLKWINNLRLTGPEENKTEARSQGHMKDLAPTIITTGRQEMKAVHPVLMTPVPEVQAAAAGAPALLPVAAVEAAAEALLLREEVANPS